jgi:hypothetical protein
VKLDLVKCDCCGCEMTSAQIAKWNWDQKPSVFNLTFPRDGINGGQWNMDVCGRCREVLFDAIRSTINRLRGGHYDDDAGYLWALQQVAMMGDTGSDLHKSQFDPDGVGETPSGWRVADAMRAIANDAIGNEPLIKTETTNVDHS